MGKKKKGNKGGNGQVSPQDELSLAEKGQPQTFKLLTSRLQTQLANQQGEENSPRLIKQADETDVDRPAEFVQNPLYDPDDDGDENKYEEVYVVGDPSQQDYIAVAADSNREPELYGATTSAERQASSSSAGTANLSSASNSNSSFSKAVDGSQSSTAGSEYEEVYEEVSEEEIYQQVYQKVMAKNAAAVASTAPAATVAPFTAATASPAPLAPTFQPRDVSADNGWDGDVYDVTPASSSGAAASVGTSKDWSSIYETTSPNQRDNSTGGWNKDVYETGEVRALTVKMLARLHSNICHALTGTAPSEKIYATRDLPNGQGEPSYRLEPLAPNDKVTIIQGPLVTGMLETLFLGEEYYGGVGGRDSALYASSEQARPLPKQDSQESGIGVADSLYAVAGSSQEVRQLSKQPSQESGVSTSDSTYAPVQAPKTDEPDYVYGSNGQTLPAVCGPMAQIRIEREDGHVDEIYTTNNGDGFTITYDKDGNGVVLNENTGYVEFSEARLKGLLGDENFRRLKAGEEISQDNVNYCEVSTLRLSGRLKPNVMGDLRKAGTMGYGAANPDGGYGSNSQGGSPQKSDGSDQNHGEYTAIDIDHAPTKDTPTREEINLAVENILLALKQDKHNAGFMLNSSGLSVTPKIHPIFKTVETPLQARIFFPKKGRRLGRGAQADFLNEEQLKLELRNILEKQWCSISDDWKIDPAMKERQEKHSSLLQRAGRWLFGASQTTLDVASGVVHQGLELTFGSSPTDEEKKKMDEEEAAEVEDEIEREEEENRIKKESGVVVLTPEQEQSCYDSYKKKIALMLLLLVVCGAVAGTILLVRNSRSSSSGDDNTKKAGSSASSGSNNNGTDTTTTTEDATETTTITLASSTTTTQDEVTTPTTSTSTSTTSTTSQAPTQAPTTPTTSTSTSTTSTTSQAPTQAPTTPTTSTSTSTTSTTSQAPTQAPTTPTTSTSTSTTSTTSQAPTQAPTTPTTSTSTSMTSTTTQAPTQAPTTPTTSTSTSTTSTTTQAPTQAPTTPTTSTSTSTTSTTTQAPTQAPTTPTTSTSTSTTSTTTAAPTQAPTTPTTAAATPPPTTSTTSTSSTTTTTTPLVPMVSFNVTDGIDGRVGTVPSAHDTLSAIANANVALQPGMTLTFTDKAICFIFNYPTLSGNNVQRINDTSWLLTNNGGVETIQFTNAYRVATDNPANFMLTVTDLTGQSYSESFVGTVSCHSTGSCPAGSGDCNADRRRDVEELNISDALKNVGIFNKGVFGASRSSLHTSRSDENLPSSKVRVSRLS